MTSREREILAGFGDRGFTFHEAVQSLVLGRAEFGWTGMFPETETARVREMVANLEIVHREGTSNLMHFLPAGLGEMLIARLERHGIERIQVEMEDGERVHFSIRGGDDEYREWGVELAEDGWVGYIESLEGEATVRWPLEGESVEDVLTHAAKTIATQYKEKNS